jgi:hypothetical protein
MQQPSSPAQITLAAAVERYRNEPGAFSNAYEWYRKQAQRDGQVSLGGTSVATVKVRNQWMVDVVDVELALAAHRDRVARQHQVTADYEAHILHGDDRSTTATDWGGYRIRGAFHSAWNSYEVYRKKSDGSWFCNTCFELVKTEYDDDWEPKHVSCARCGTSMDM